MTESQKNELLERISRVRKEVEIQQRRKTLLTLRREQLQRELEKIHQQMRDLGTTPETVEADLQVEYERRLREVSEAERILAENDRVLSEAESVDRP